jgi:uncharacterized protein (TIGR00255 family)
MTGFARTEGEHGATRWVCEVRSLNGRGLDIRCRLAPGLEGLEPAIRTLTAERFSRGSLQLALNIISRAGPVELRLNREALDQVLKLLREFQGVSGVAPARLDGLLMLKGVLEAVEPEESEAARAAREAALLTGIAEALDQLKSARRGEGRQLAEILSAQLARVARIVESARRSAAAAPEAIKARLKEQLQLLLDAQPKLDPERLAQEAALLAAKADIMEELDRLDAHISQAQTLLRADEPVGRKLEFLTQELMREANTLCAKSQAIELTRLGLDLKAAIDQLREQIQNVE